LHGIQDVLLDGIDVTGYLIQTGRNGRKFGTASVALSFEQRILIHQLLLHPPQPFIVLDRALLAVADTALELGFLRSQLGKEIILPRLQHLRAMHRLIKIAAQRRNVLLAQRDDFLILTGSGLRLFLRLLLDAALEFPLGLFEISLLCHTSRHQSEPRRGQHEQSES
jgi:hypothetical protein